MCCLQEEEEVGRPTTPLCYSETRWAWIPLCTEADSHSPCLKCIQNLIYRGDSHKMGRSMPWKEVASHAVMCRATWGSTKLTGRQRSSQESKAQSLYGWVSQEGMGETGQVKILIKISEPRAKEVISSCPVPGSGGILAWCIRVREKKWLGLGLGGGWLGYERHANR